MLREIQPRHDWNFRIVEVQKEAKRLKKLRVLTAFNAVTDYIKHVDTKTIEKAFHSLDEPHKAKVLERSLSDLKHLDTPVDFLAAMLHAMRIGKAGLFVASPTLFKWFDDIFGDANQKRLGGQAALMAVQLKELGAEAYLYPAFLSIDQAKLLEGRVTIPFVSKKKLAFTKPLKAARPADPTSASWIFEFKRGDVIEVRERIECPRDNRVIVTYPPAYVPVFGKEMEPLLGQLSKKIDLLVVSGYHALQPKTYKPHLKEITKQLQKMRSANRKLKIHYEFVPFEDETVERDVLLQLGKTVDSIGMNEVELAGVLHTLGFKKEAQELEKHESAETIYHGAVAVLDKLKVQRLHVHSLGYNVVVTTKKADPLAARDGALFGSVSASLKSMHGHLDQKVFSQQSDLKISEAGYNQIGTFESSVWDEWQKRKRKPISSLLRKQFMSAGIFDEKSHVAIIVPTPIASGLKTTVGLGDVVSGCAIAYETASKR